MIALPPGLTRFAHYAALPLSTHGGGKRAWTHESALMALVLFVQEEGVLPHMEHLNAREGLPSYETVLHLYRSIRAYRAAYEAATGQTGPDPPASPYAREVPCPRCNRRWHSPDSRHYRTCKPCLEREGADDGMWLNGTPVILNGLIDLDDDWEE